MDEPEHKFQIVSSNDMEHLSDILATIVREHPLGDPFACEYILIMNLGMQNYLSQQLSRRNGIMARCEFLQIWQLIFKLHRLLNPECDKVNRFSRDHLVYGLIGVLQDLKTRGHPILKSVKNYLKADTDGRRIYELASQLADVLDQYQLYRPEVMAQWDRALEENPHAFAELEAALKEDRGELAEILQTHPLGRLIVRGHSKARQQLIIDNLWQFRLWQEFRDRLHFIEHDPSRLAPEAAAHPEADADFPLTGERLELARLDRAQTLGRLMADLAAAVQSGREIPNFPERIFIFGISSLPESVLQLLHLLSQKTQIFFMFFNPCADYWGDIRPEWAGKQRTFGTGPKAPEIAFAPEDFADGERISGQPLLLAYGRQGRDTLCNLFSLDPPPDFIPSFIPPEKESLLDRVRQDLLHLDEAPGEKFVIADNDVSLQIHSCHTRLREVEVLRDHILGCFADDAAADRKLDPSEVLVMVPTINDYAPFINAVFGQVPPEDPSYLPYTISDRSVEATSQVAGAVIKLLDLSQHLITASAVLDLLAVPAIGRKFGIAGDDLAVISSWCDKVGISWGLDGQDTRAEIKSDLGLHSSFDYGEQLLVGGYLTGAGPDVPYAGIEGDDARLLGNFHAFISALRQLRDEFAAQSERVPEDWQDFVGTKIADRFFTADEETLEDLKVLGQTIEELVSVSRDFKVSTRLSLPVFTALLSEALTAERGYSRFLCGAINFCSLVPMRAVPFRHIFILGLNDGDFPRRERAPGINLLMEKCFFRRGDRSRIADDRYLFLEAILSARESLYLSYIGQNPRNKEELNPSVVLTEFMDYLKDRFVVNGAEDNDAAVERRLLRREHLNAHDLQNYVTQETKDTHELPRRPSFDAGSFVPPSPEGAEASPEAARLGNLELVAPALDRGEVQLDELLEFVRAPAKYFLRRKVGINVEIYSQQQLADSEPFALRPFDVNCLSARILGGENSYAALESLGNWPQGIFSGFVRDEVERTVELVQKGLEGAPVSAPRPFLLDIPREEGGIWHLGGQIAQAEKNGDPFHEFGKLQAAADLFDRLEADRHLEGGSLTGYAAGLKDAAQILCACIRMAVQVLVFPRQGVSQRLVDRLGNILDLRSPEADVAQDFLSRVLTLFAEGQRVPFPMSRKLLEKPWCQYKSDPNDDMEKQFAYDNELVYLFGNMADVCADATLHERYTRFYLTFLEGALHMALTKKVRK